MTLAMLRLHIKLKLHSKRGNKIVSIKKGCVVVTGAGKGLGVALAKESWLRGYSLALISRTESDLVGLKNEIEKDGIRFEQTVSIHPLDLANQNEVSTCFREIQKSHASIAALINNAGTWTGGSRVIDLTPSDFEKSLSLNFFSAVFATHEALSLWKLKKSSDLAIVNVGATASVVSGPWSAPFGAAKSALRAYSQSLAREMAKEGVHVAHLVIDGLIDNPRTRALNPQYPAARFMSCESIARSILNVVQEDRSCWTFEWDMRPNLAEW
jgi:short-subunit dehydrogenase